MILLLLRKEIYLPFLLSILLFITIDSSFYNYIALGKENSENDNEGGGESEERDNKENSENDNEGGGESEERDNKENSENDNEGGGESEAEEDFEDMSLNELFDDDSNGDDNTREEKEGDKEKEEKEDVPFILPFRAVPFP
jgi:Ca-activated chloride channel homolog